MRGLFVLSSVFGFLAVAFGAFGAHGLERLLATEPDKAVRMSWWTTASQYHLIHAVALGLCAIVYDRTRGSRHAVFAGAGFVSGVALFCGTLYAMALGAPRWFGMVTPIGGMCWLAAWLFLARASLSIRESK